MEKTQVEADEMSENDGVLLVKRFKSSKLSQRVFCRENDINRSTLRYWIERSEDLTYGKEVRFCELVLGGDSKC